jgi:hypothetical protein
MTSERIQTDEVRKSIQYWEKKVSNMDEKFSKEIVTVKRKQKANRTIRNEKTQ